MKPQELLSEYTPVAGILRSTLDPRTAREFWPSIREFLEEPKVPPRIDAEKFIQVLEDKDYQVRAIRYAGDIISGDKTTLTDWERDFAKPEDAEERARLFATGTTLLFGNIRANRSVSTEAGMMLPSMAERLETEFVGDLARMVAAGGKPYEEQKRILHRMTVDWLTRPLPFLSRFVDTLSRVKGVAYPVLSAKLPTAIAHVDSTATKLGRHLSGTGSLELVLGDLPTGMEVESLFLTMGRLEQFDNTLEFEMKDGSKKKLEISVADAVEFYYGDYGEQQFRKRSPDNRQTWEPLYEVAGGPPGGKTLRELRTMGYNDVKLLTDPSIRPLLDFDPLRLDTTPFEKGSGCIRPGERLAVLNSTDADEFGSRDFRNLLLKRAGINPDEVVRISGLGSDGEKLDYTHPLVSGEKDDKVKSQLLGAESLAARESLYRSLGLKLHVALGSSFAFDPGYRGENALDALVKAMGGDRYTDRYQLFNAAMRELFTGLYSFLPSNKPGYMPIYAAMTGKIAPDWRLHHRNPLSPEEVPMLKPITRLSEQAKVEIFDTFFAARSYRSDIERDYVALNRLVAHAEAGATEAQLLALAKLRRSERIDRLKRGALAGALSGMGVMDIRSRQAMWAIASNLTEATRRELQSSDWKEYLESMGYSVMNLDPIEYKGILGMFKAIHIHNWRTVRWGQKDNLVFKWWKYLNDAGEHFNNLMQLAKLMPQAKDTSFLQSIGVDIDFIKSRGTPGFQADDIFEGAKYAFVKYWLSPRLRDNALLTEYIGELVKTTLKSGEISFQGPMGQRRILLDIVQFTDRMVNGYLTDAIFTGMAGQSGDTAGQHGTARSFVEVKRTAVHYEKLRRAVLIGGDHLVENGVNSPYICTGDGIPARKIAMLSPDKPLQAVVNALAVYGHRGAIPQTGSAIMMFLEDAGMITHRDRLDLEKLLQEEHGLMDKALAESVQSGKVLRYLTPVKK